jgi:hypothetical protein
MRLLYSLLFWGLVAFCFMVQARYLEYPLEHVPYYAFLAAWLFIVNQGTKGEAARKLIIATRQQKTKRKRK